MSSLRNLGVGRAWLSSRARRLRNVTGAVLAVGALLVGSAVTADASGAQTAPDSVAGMPGFQQGSVPTSNGYLHYVRGGSGPVLVLLHGWPETWNEWRSVMPDLAKTHTVVAFDLPGLGTSNLPADGKYDTQAIAADLHEGVHALGYSNIAILAHDVGSLVAYPYARDFPGEVSRMAVLEAPLNGFGLENAYGLSWHFLFNMAPYPVPEQIMNDQAHVAVYLHWLFSSARHPDAIAQTADIYAYTPADHRSAGFDYYRAYPTNATEDKTLAATKLTIPIMAMGAQYVFGPAVAQSFANVGTDVRTVVAPDSGHWIPEENPTFLAQCSDLFFGDGSTQPSSTDLTNCVP